MKKISSLTLLLISCLPVWLPAHAESLYVEGSYRPLAGDNRAHQVGDLLTVQVFENSSASTTTDTSTQRTNKVSAGVSSLLSSRQLGGSITQDGAFDGGGTTQRANKLLTTLSVTVREVLPNGDLKVSGEQLLMVNEEQHKVDLEGRVRPQDISSDNVVLSTRLADAHINYIGEGDLSDRQKRAWWRRIADWLGL
ncbi:flagellar L-ring protein FlgH [Herbaspirillum rubrisubalbicans]|uniref:flagellar basal body L-ring protein FlgH n=1 Tax=Herbaspirillum rubrisubalbicans TaxID=80842 RepID=UPI000DC38D3E|nr:flagellar basal body L-ring protein FlgH [Herbaspirillum rubrisubalbicans]RAN48435.1 flagellar L-ring protein FlgH [Herbaspirillum rubrisubalbicans]